MSREGQSLYSLNRGVISRYGLARLDVKRLALAAETQTNWMPRVLGGMMLRPGMKYIGATYTNAAARYLKFIFATDDTALLEMTASLMRVWINDALLSRPAVTTTVTNGDFSGAGSWANYSDAGAITSVGAGVLILRSNAGGTAQAITENQVTVAGGNIGVEHGLRIVVGLGPVDLQIGSSSGGEQYVSKTTLGTGTHSISLTPTGDFFVRFTSFAQYEAYLTQCTIEAAGVVTLPTPWGASDLGKIRHDQSGDVIYVACSGYQQRKIERRGTRPNARSWSIVKYEPANGPFNIQNLGPITLTPSALWGNIGLTASKPLFKSTHVGSLFSITSAGQTVSTSSAVSGTPTSSIRITGVGGARSFTIQIGSDASGSTVDLQRSYDNSTWANVVGKSWTANTTETYTDGLDNQIVYYRLILTTRIAPDTVSMVLITLSGSVRAIVKIVIYTSSTAVTAVTISGLLGSTTATSIWQEGKWSDYRGWPTAVQFHEGRLWWSGGNGAIGSVSDAYESFDETVVGDSGPIDRTIGSGPVDTVNWLLSLKGLVVGAQGAEFVARASSLDEPITPTNFNLKSPSSQGSGAVSAVKVDQVGYFINRSRVKLFGLEFDVRSYDYSSSGMMELCPEIGYPGIVRMDVQRLPDTRIHCVLSDGTVAVLILNPAEEVAAWIKVTTSGTVEDVVVLPATDGSLDDQVYYVVNRTINGATVRYLEKWAQEIDCRGDKQYCYLADAYVAYSGAPATVITGLSHLEGQQVVVWADGRDVGTIESTDPWTQTYTVAGGQITLAVAASNVVAGLGYTASFKSAKLGSNMQGKSALNQQKKIGHVGLVMADVYRLGLKYGPASDYLDDIPLNEQGTDVTAGTHTSYDEQMIEFPGTWTTDSRIYLQAQAPRPCTVLAVTMDEVQS